MIKPDSFRAAIAAAVPHLVKDPSKLAIYIDRGRIVSRLGRDRQKGFEYRFRMRALLIDYPADKVDAVMIAALEWIRVNQPDLLLSHQRGNDAIPFEADIIDDKTIDLDLSLELSEAVVLQPREGGGFDLVHLPEPPVEAGFADVPPLSPLGEVWLGDDRVIPGPA